MKVKKIKAKELDKRFDDGEDVLDYFDLDSIERPNLKSKRVNVDFPQWMVTSLDMESARLGISRQSLIKTVIGEHIDHLKKAA